MKKIALFICDIMDAITLIHQDQEYIHYHKLIENLEQIRDTYDADELLFSFSTGDINVNYLFSQVEKLIPYLKGSNIKLGNQYMDFGCFDKDEKLLYNYDYLNKISEIKNQINLLQEDRRVVWVGYADDGLNPYSMKELVDSFPNISEIHGFIPSTHGKTNSSNLICSSNKYGLEGLIEALENYNNPNIIKDSEIRANSQNNSTKSKQIKIESPIILTDKLPQTTLDNYRFLINRGYELERIPGFDETVNFIGEMYRRMNYVGHFCFGSAYSKKEQISREEIYKLNKLIEYYSKNAFMYCANYNVPNGKQYNEIYNVLNDLSSNIYGAGYLHKYTSQEIENVRMASSILALSLALNPVNDYKMVKAVPNNRYYRICVFRKEYTPSLLLYENTQSFNCFNCGNSGNIFSYLMKLDSSISFPIAVETLAESFQIELSEKGRVNARNDIVESILKAVESDFYKYLKEISREKTERQRLLKK